MLLNVFIILVSGLTLGLLFLTHWSKSEVWKATLTPLASIIGSGFLILGPLLQNEMGTYALVGMLFLCIAAYVVGAVIRYNIKEAEPLIEAKSLRPLLITERISDYALVLAYVVSITYYLNLFGAFLLKGIGMEGGNTQKITSTAVIAFIGGFGFFRGLNFLEKMEKISVSLKLSIIAGLIFGLFVFNGQELIEGSWQWNEPHVTFTWNSVAILMGLIITVQGFETSRFLGEEYDQVTRIKSMRHAQWASSAIYLLYIGLSMVNYAGEVEGSSAETAIIDQSAVVASVLPILLVVAALASQFSAAVADTNGGGGLFHEVSQSKISSNLGILIICSCGVLLTWLFDIFQIISLASKAFALFYCIQCLSAMMVSYRNKNYRVLAMSAVVFLLCLAIVFVGKSAE